MSCCPLFIMQDVPDILVLHTSDSGLCYFELLSNVLLGSCWTIQYLLQMFPCLGYGWYLSVYGLPPASFWLWTWRTWSFSRKCLSLELLLLAAYATSMVYLFISCIRIEAVMLMLLICLKERWDLKFDTDSLYNIQWIHIFIVLMF